MYMCVCIGCLKNVENREHLNKSTPLAHTMDTPPKIIRTVAKQLKTKRHQLNLECNPYE